MGGTHRFRSELKRGECRAGEDRALALATPPDETRKCQASRRLLISLPGLLLRLACNGHQVDAVAIALAVRKIVAEVRAVDGDRFAVLENAHVFPHHLRIR
eukprot:6199243-Pleurochrysis_carterae.AAC.2